MLSVKLKLSCDYCCKVVETKPAIVHVDDENVMRIVNPMDVLPGDWVRTRSGEYLCGTCRKR